MKTILVANRGEIAIRIIRACEEMNIRTVSVYSDVDEHSLFFRLADHYVHLEGKDLRETYLNIDLLVKTALETGCDGVHPGYGFLSESPEFVKACEKAGLKFIGPGSKVMQKVGDKNRIKDIMAEAGVPALPSVKSSGSLKDMKSLKEAAKRIGYPLMIKPTYGGGGKGMQIVRSEAEFRDAVESAARIGRSAFGKADFYIEKYLERSHHIEVQIIADSMGNISDLGERECSIQRRHQKLIEESPSPSITEKERREVARLARTAAKAVGYENAGTIEFLYEDGHFYFLEVNARIQVEHGVTELVTGIDLVKEQISIASGKRLSIKHKTALRAGHAIECRINAEDPYKNFIPSPGKLKGYRSPGGPGVRVDSGVFMGFEIPPDFDSLVSKLQVWGRDRDEAVQRMKRALKEYVILGIRTTLPLYRAVVREKDFKRGDYTTNYIDTHHDKLIEMMDNLQNSRTFHYELLESVFKKKQVLVPICDANLALETPRLYDDD